MIWDNDIWYTDHNFDEVNVPAAVTNGSRVSLTRTEASAWAIFNSAGVIWTRRVANIISSLGAWSIPYSSVWCYTGRLLKATGLPDFRTSHLHWIIRIGWIIPKGNACILAFATSIVNFSRVATTSYLAITDDNKEKEIMLWGVDSYELFQLKVWNRLTNYHFQYHPGYLHKIDRQCMSHL